MRSITALGYLGMAVIRTEFSSLSDEGNITVLNFRRPILVQMQYPIHLFELCLDWPFLVSCLHHPYASFINCQHSLVEKNCV
jgi:hypothetical protein